MFRNYFKTAWRNLLKHKFYAFINIAGLTTGLTVGLLILLWVRDEMSFDSFHRKADSIYKLQCWGGTGTSRQVWTDIISPMGILAKQQLPEVTDVVRITYNGYYSQYQYKNKTFSDDVAVFVDPSFFSVFDFPLIAGNNAKPFSDDHAVVITRKIAEKYFGQEDPIGKVIIADGKESFTVTGVINNFPHNSSMRYDMMMPMSLKAQWLIKDHRDINTDFNYFSYTTYLLIKPDAPFKSLSDKLYKIHLRHKAEDTDVEYLFQPLKELHLHNPDGSPGGMETVKIFIVVALLILVIACINYVNLSTARATLRSREVSMRKVIGAARSQLFMQFIIETLLLFLFAVALSLLLIHVLLPAFNLLSGKELVFNLADRQVWLLLLITFAGTLAASSIYPALLLSSFEPLRALQGRLTAGMGNAAFRKGLVVTQFVFSVILITGTLVIGRQLQYIQSKELGYDKSYVFTFSMRNMKDHYEVVKDELLKQPGIQDITRANGNIVAMGNITGNSDWDGKAANQTFIVHPMSVDKSFIPFFKMKLKEGQPFRGGAADSGHYILNEAAVKEIGMKDPIGKRFALWGIQGTVTGVISDFHFTSMKEKIGPAVLYSFPHECELMYVRTSGKDAAAAIGAVNKIFRRYNGDYPFRYDFLDEVFNQLYRSEQRTGSLFSLFAGIAILISCLGLLGLATYTAQVRTREIGVRKVLGASIVSIIQLLAKDFISLVIIAIIIAVPLAWYIMGKWLQDFAYRVNMGWQVFAAAGLIAVFIALITISYQSVKAAVVNPAASLKGN